MFGISVLPSFADLSTSENPAPRKRFSRMFLPGTEELQLIVELSQPSVLERMQADQKENPSSMLESLSASGKFHLQSYRALTYRAAIEQAQQTMAETLSARSGVAVEGAVSTVMNALIVRTGSDQYDYVRKLAGVKKVYFSRPQKLLLNTSASLVNAQGLWNRAGGNSSAGRGIKIGIIDTGIDITHPMFIDDSLTAPSGFPKGESNFSNSKVIVARNYISYLSRSQSVRTAIDEVGHGTFVAGVAAGKQVSAPAAVISGMAPGAFLGSYKVFGTPGVNDSTTTAAVLAAVNDAVSDGMDVINLSLGALDYVLPEDDPEIQALEKAVQAGVIVCASAGNDGPDAHTISNPGAAPSAITVGSVSNSRIFGSLLHVVAPTPVPANLENIAYTPSDGLQVTSKIPSTGIVDVQSLDGNGYGCSSFSSGSLSGKIALIQRGGVATACTFYLKVTNAASAGASAVIVYNNVPNGGTDRMADLSAASIPAVMIAYLDGVAIKNLIASAPESVRVEIDRYTTTGAATRTGGVLSDFSAIGPSTDYGIKPDLVAIGENVYSAAESVSPSGDMYSATKYLTNDGTSFSSPMVAGAAAALQQLYPSLDAYAIKSLITTTASRNVTSDGTTPASIIQAGSGLLDMGNASAAGAVFTPTNLNFGVHTNSKSLSLSRSFTIRNIGTTADQYSISLETLTAGPSITFNQEVTDSIAPSGTATIQVQLYTASPISGGFQGFVQVRSLTTSMLYRIPYWAGLCNYDTSRILTVSQSASGSGTYSTLTAALAAARPGNIIEIADSSSYTAGLTIGLNQEGLPLHGLTIRAASGQTPTLNGSSINNQADIEIVGLKDVLLQGLKISGGAVGIEVSQSSTDEPFSVTIDQCTITNIQNSYSSSGVESSGNGKLEITRSTIENVYGPGVYLEEGVFFTMQGSFLQNNSYSGIIADTSDLQVLNSTISGNIGPGLYVTNCIGTLEGNQFSSQTGNYGDGAEIIDSYFTIRNNTFSANQRFGLAFYTDSGSVFDSTIEVSQNTFSGNLFYAFLGDSGQNLCLDGNLIKDNARGILLRGTTNALLRNNIVTRSTSTSNGSGVEVTGAGKIRLINNTVYANGYKGVLQTGSGTLYVRNTIIGSNTGGDLQTLSSADIDFSLIGDQKLSGSNLKGEAQMTNPAADDFSLASGSPAINAGSNEAAELPFLDFRRKMRVASGSTFGDTGTVDIGALEYGSTYPLVFPLMANGNQSALGDNYTTGLALVDYSSEATLANFAAYSPSGSYLSASTNPATQALSAGSQISTLAYQLFGFDSSQSNLGGILTGSAQRLAGFFLLFDSEFRRFAEGIPVSDRTTTDLIFPYHLSDTTTKTVYCLFNPGIRAANIKAVWYSASGNASGSVQTAIVAPRGQILLHFDGMTGASGYVRIESDRPISGLELIGNSQDVSILGAAAPASEARLFFPHIACHQGFTTVLGIVNTNTVASGVVLTAYDDDGRVLGTPAEITIPANGQMVQSAASLFGLTAGSQVTTGYVVAENERQGLLGFTHFTYADGDRRSAAAVPADYLPRKKLLFSHVAHQVPAGSGVNYQTGIALLNPYGTAITFTMRVFNAAGNLLAEKTETLAPRQKASRILSYPAAGAGFFTESLTLAGGHIEVTSEYGLYGFELFYTEDLTQLVGVPAQLAD